MDTHCPKCSTELSGRYLQSSLRAGLAGRAPITCCGCGAGLRVNIHPKEGQSQYWMYLGIGAATVAPALGFELSWVAKSAIALSPVVGALAYEWHLYKVVLASWPRYIVG
jgi:hypothetical protein